MLQFNKLPTPETQITAVDSYSSPEAVANFVKLIYRQYPMIILVALVTAALGAKVGPCREPIETGVP